MSDTAARASEAAPVTGGGSWEGLSSVAVLACAVGRRRAADRAEAELLAIAAHWADLHPLLSYGDAAEGVSVAGMERLMPLAGAGTPPVAEFAAAELGAALDMSTYAGQSLIGDALELRHRLPRLWARVLDGSLPAWRARKVAEHTRHLSPEAAAWVDAQVVAFAHKIGLGRVITLVQAALVRFDPDEAARQHKAAVDGRGVWLSAEMTSGTRSVLIEADALDATAFDQTIDSLATALAAYGDDDVADLRRAKAVGVIADPQSALDLLLTARSSHQPDSSHSSHSSHSTHGSRGDDRAAGVEDCTTDTGAAAPAGPAGTGARGGRWNPSKRGNARRPKVVLYLHLHESAIMRPPGSTSTGSTASEAAGSCGVGRVEGLGPVTTEQIKQWVGHGEVSVRPVLDLDDRASVDAYEVPTRMAETVYLRNPCCPFPWCENLTRNKDNDHIAAFVPPDTGGPPGQTAADKLAPLCRRHHRLKTHSGWTYTMPEPGIYLWRSPHHRRYLVDHTGTTPLGPPR